jgi:hypothetical protein
MFVLPSSLTIAAEPFVLIGSENRISEAGVVPRAKAIVDVGVTDHLSVTTTFMLSSGYAEAYVGPTWSPTKSFSLGIAGGMETADAPWRVMAYSSLHIKGFRLLGIAEYGGSGSWYKAMATYDIGPISVGALARRFDGFGPRVGVNYAHFELWAAAPLYDFESGAPSGLVGLNWTP